MADLGSESETCVGSCVHLVGVFISFEKIFYRLPFTAPLSGSPFRSFMSDFGEEYTHVPLQCDSTSAISVAKNPMLHSKTKHKEVRYHFLRDNVEKGKITLIHVPTHDQLADRFTKPLDQATFTHLRGGGSLVFV
jgi:hypothetical protein